jgi:phosphoribosylamine--glycine ligase
MKVLVVGSGGREHALAWRLANSPSVGRLYVAPGNAGTAQIADNVPLSAEDIPSLVAFVAEEKIDLTVVGPEAPLVAGLVDALSQEGRLAFGPTARAAAIEGSKVFSKELMLRYGVPTGQARTFTAFDVARAYIETLEPPIVVKADGLAAGKGVVVARSVDEAVEAARQMMVEKKFGTAGEKILVEEFLDGEELSFFVLTDGHELLPLTSAQDYKRAYDGDEGPNTGGMGSYSPCQWLDASLVEHVLEKIFEPVVYALAREGYPYRGVLYGGLIRTADGIKVLEFNCRFGDPETQAIMPRLETDLAAVLASAAEGDLRNAPRLNVSDSPVVTVVLASGGYPESYRTGFVISGLEKARSVPGVQVFHAGTKWRGNEIVTAGGRVLNVTARGGTFAEARKRAYEAASYIFFENMHYRKDIALRVL